MSGWTPLWLAALTLASTMVLMTAALAADLTPPADSVVDPHGLTGAVGAPYGRAFNGEAFQFDGITSFNGFQYTAYWAQDVPATSTRATYHVGVGRRKLPDGPWETLDLRDSAMTHALSKTGKPWDVHNTVSLGLCPGDGTLHLAYDHHNHPLRYRVTAPGVVTRPEQTKWTAGLFGPETSSLGGVTVNTVCYPAFTPTPTGDMILTLRRGQSGDGAWWIYPYDAKAHQWHPGHQYDDGRHATYAASTQPSERRCAYPNGWTFGPDGTLHVTYVYREEMGPGKGGNGSNHDIHYAHSLDGGRTWKNDAGRVVSAIDGAGGAPKQFTLASPGMVIVPLTQGDSLMNEQAQAVDSKGRLHVLMWHRDPAKTTPPADPWEPLECSYFHYWRAAAGDWKRATLPGRIGGRPRLAFDTDDTLYAVYATPTDESAAGLYFDAGRLVIARATAAADWTDWTVVATRPGPFLGEPMIDVPRVKRDGVLSVFVQDTPTADGQATPLRVLDYAVR